jgi:hypothetical protein
LYVTFGESGDIRLARLLPKLITFEPPPCIWFMRKIQKPDQEQEREEPGEERPPRARARALRVELDVVLLEHRSGTATCDCGDG